MKGIHVALIGVLTCDAVIRCTSAGREWISFQIVVDVASGAIEPVLVGGFSPESISLAPLLVRDVQVYIEGKLRLRPWRAETSGGAVSQLSVSASKIEPLALIGNRRPVKKRVTTKSRATSAEPAFNDPLPF